jgi:deoxyadenosine/deoxycytidine kinase
VKYKPCIWVEGIIGCGKTTFSREVGSRLGLRVIEEPVETNPYLELFYKDQKTHAFGMQMLLLARRYAMQQLASYECTPAGNLAGAILDRSLSGDRVFAKMHRDSGNISELDWQTYEEIHSIMARSLLPPTLLVYLDVQPQTAYERMKKRNRGAEVNVGIDYLTKLREYYKGLIAEAERGLLPWAHAIHVMHISADVDTVTAAKWDHTAESIADRCRR